MPLEYGQPKFPVIDAAPSLTTGAKNFRSSDLAVWGGLTAVSLPYGYAFGHPLRKQTMVVAGMLGCLGGFMLALQNSFSRLMGYKENGIEVAQLLNKKE